MKNFFYSSILLLTLFVSTSFNIHSVTQNSEIKWLSWEEGYEESKKSDKKIFVDVYTNWCGWCKRMDNSTFKDSKIVSYINENFIPIKLNAEQKEIIKFKGREFKYTPSGRRGHHELASALLNGKMSYPSYVFLTNDYQTITLLAGFTEIDKMNTVLTFINDDKYKTTTYKEYEESLK